MNLIVFILGHLLCGLGAAMLVPAFVDAAVDNADWQAFVWAGAVTAFIGGAMILTSKGVHRPLSRSQGFILTFLAWSIIAAFGALPFLFAELPIGIADAYFEAMSGLTTTGSTVLTGLDNAPPGILLWRSMLQWLGGIGIVVMAIALLPFLRVGGMQLFQMESSDKSDKVMPQIKRITLFMCQVYLAMTVLCALSLWVAGMSGFEAVNHAMTTVSTGGYSTSDDSIGHFKSPTIEWIVTVFMVLGALPFILFLKTVLGDRWALVRDPQVQGLVFVIAISSAAIALWLSRTTGLPFADAIRHTAFNITSVVTTTGFASVDYGTWGPMVTGAFFLLTFVGGCTGSTSGGIKVFRFQILVLALRVYALRLFHPHRAFTPSFGGRPVSFDIMHAVVLFLAVYLVSVGIIGFALAAMGLDFVTAFSGAATALGNVGPGLGATIGPAGNFATLPEGAKWVLTFAMLLGRLELFTVLVLLSPDFWRA